MQKVIITSKNPVKIEAAKLGFEKMFPEKRFEFTGVSIASEVSDQPMTSNETHQGALNRLKNAKVLDHKADFYVSVEGGVEEINGELESFAWILIELEGYIGKAKTATFYLPPLIAKLILDEDKELGEVDDIVFGVSNSKQTNGSVGLLTGDVLTRTSFLSEAICFALIPFKNPELYLIDKVLK